MQYFVLKTHKDQTPIFDGAFTSFIACLEDAVKKEKDLSNIDLKHQNLSNANLDNAYMPGAELTGANLTGANFSESNLIGAHLQDSELYNTCFAYSEMSHSDFRGASFGATMIEGCIIDGATFSTLSCFDLDFRNVATMKDCKFESFDGALYGMTKHPIVLKGLLNTPIVILDQTITIGANILPKTILPALLNAMTSHEEQARLRDIAPVINYIAST